MKITRNGSQRPRETPTTLVEERKIQVDLGRRGTARLKNFFHYNLLNDPSFTEE